MAELLLDVSPVNLRGAGEAGARGMAGVERQPFGPGQVAVRAGAAGGALDEVGDVVVGQAAGQGALRRGKRKRGPGRA